MTTKRKESALIRAYASSVGVTPSGITDDFMVSIQFIDVKEVLAEIFKDTNQQTAIDWVIDQYGEHIKERLNEQS